MGDYNEERMEESYDEAELSDDEFEELSFDDLLDRVESNDPSLTSVKISTLSTIVLPNNNALQHRLERLGTAIGRNTQLNALMFDGYELIGEEQINEAQAVNLFLGIACNQSIKRLHFKYCDEYLENICRILTPVFKNNQVERVIFYSCNQSYEGIGLLATLLAGFDSLKEFILAARLHIPQQAARELMQSLNGHPRLRKLYLSNTNVGKLGCSALVDLLSNPNINLRVLDLPYNNLGDAEAVVLASGMAGNTTLHEINLAGNRGITEVGWQALFDPLNNSSCRLEKLKLKGNYINAAAAQSLSNALTSSTTLKTLDLGLNPSITLTGWRTLFESLSSPTCVLEDLDLRYNKLNDEVITSLTDALASDVSLKSLNLSSNRGVTGDGWQRLFSIVLSNPISGLEKLELRWCGINDTAIRVLTNALVNNSKLKVLFLNGNDLISNLFTDQFTDTGWETFVAVFESPSTALEELNLRGNALSAATCTVLLNSLVNNKKLKTLILEHSDDWSPSLSLLCNTHSIMSTYISNHSLQKVGHEDDNSFPEEFESLLQIHRENSPSQAARLKIINAHFKDCFITQPFVDMDLIMLPHAMAWMSRDGRAGEVNDHFYGFIKSISSLFENVN